MCSPAFVGSCQARLWRVSFQIRDVKPYRGRTFRFRAAVRVDPWQGGFARILVRIHKQNGETSFYSNMADRRITSIKWAVYQIRGPVYADASDIELGMQFFGNGSAWLDATSLTFSR